jgi:hypothetical protein
MNHRILSLFPLLLTAPLLAQGEVDLRTTAKKGNSVWLAVETKMEQVMDMGGREMETAQNTTRVLHVNVKDVDDKGNLVVETRIARVHGSVTTPMGMADFEFDSAGPQPSDDEEGGMPGMSPGTMRKAMLAGAGKSFTATVDARGKVVELKDGAAELLKGNEGGMMSGNSLDEGTLKRMVEGAFGTLPEKPVAVGSKWEHKQKDTNGRLPMEHKVEMTLAKADDEAFEITAAGTVEKPAAAADANKEGDVAGEDPQEAMAREMMKSMKVKNGKLTGSQRVSRKDGFVLDATSTITMDVEMNAGPMGEMTMTMKSTNVTKRATAEAADAKKAEAPKTEPKKDEAGKEAGK